MGRVQLVNRPFRPSTGPSASSLAFSEAKIASPSLCYSNRAESAAGSWCRDLLGAEAQTHEPAHRERVVDLVFHALVGLELGSNSRLVELALARNRPINSN